MIRKLHLATSPHLKDEEQTAHIMRELIYTLLPVLAIAVYYFGFAALWVVMSSVLGALLPEWIWKREGLKDGSAILTGLLLGLTLPPGIALWIAFLGGFVSIVVGKLVWGGLGQNVFNPALVGRAFLQSAFPIAITTWNNPGGWTSLYYPSNLAMPFMQSAHADGLTGATPLSIMKFEGQSSDIMHLFLGSTRGSIGETCGIVLVLIGAYLLYKKLINWRIPLSILLTVLVGSSLFYWMGTGFANPLFTLFSGGLMLGTVFMATDPVTSPLAPRGIWIYGIGIGVLVLLIRYFGGLPEGVMYAILLMNAFTPMINRFVKIRTYGHKK
ncbi:MAG: RnfABCDGE type electron transport complex subunit D [Cyclobacteriaceae bacterium]|nr:RnfABCDGE type electron transport complex subunit D [Cyclobacteriaceae bacterium]